MNSTASRLVCIVDDDGQVRRFLAEVMSSMALPVDEYASGEEFMRRWRPGSAGCVLLDIRMPRVTGPEVHEWIRERSPETPVIFLSGHADVPTAVRAMHLGAFDFIEKPFNVQHLIERVNSALDSAASRQKPDPGGQGEFLQQLTPRESEVLERIVAGKRNKVIASELNISERTVETHRAHIMDKAEVGTVAELVTKALAAFR